MELVDKMANGRLKTPYRAEGGVSDEREIAYGGDDRLRQYLPLYALRGGRATYLDTSLHR
jgi:hypothetical protein